MKNHYKTLTLILVILFEIVFFVTAIINLFERDWKNLLLSFSVAFFIITPYFIILYANKKKIILPHSFSLVCTLFIFSSLYLGEILNFYSLFPWWDLLLHAVAGGYFTIIGFHLIQGVYNKDQGISIRRYSFFIALFTFCFSITLGTLWEIFEYAGDFFIHANMVKGGLKDTMLDLIAKLLASLVISFLTYRKSMTSF